VKVNDRSWAKDTDLPWVSSRDVQLQPVKIALLPAKLSDLILVIFVTVAP